MGSRQGVLQLTLPPRTQGQRPPPFDGPPTAIGCGGESEWEGDRDAYVRAVQNFMNLMAAAAVLTEWSIETLAFMEEIHSQHVYICSFKWHSSANEGPALDLGYDACLKRLILLEDKAFHSKIKKANIAEFDSGWIGPQDPTTLIILNEVRDGLMLIWRQIRVGQDAPHEASRNLIEEIMRGIDDCTDQLFRISGPDEMTWLTEIGKLFDASRALRKRATRLQKLLSDS